MAATVVSWAAMMGSNNKGGEEPAAVVKVRGWGEATGVLPPPCAKPGRGCEEESLGGQQATGRHVRFTGARPWAPGGPHTSENICPTSQCSRPDYTATSSTNAPPREPPQPSRSSTTLTPVRPCPNEAAGRWFFCPHPRRAHSVWVNVFLLALSDVFGACNEQNVVTGPRCLQ